MNSRIILAGLSIAVLTSCSTAYKAQTPDDVYYSPARAQEEYVRVETEKDRNAYRDEEFSDDRYLRWKVRNRSRWSNFDDYGYDYYDNRFGSWSYNPYWNRNTYWSASAYWNNYWYWNNYYNPYCGRVIVVNPKNPVVYNQVRNYTPGTYKTTYNNTNNSVRIKPGGGVYSPGVYNNNNRTTNSNSGSFGNTIKKVFSSPSNSNDNSGSDSRPSRTYTPSSSNSSSGSSGTRSSGSSGSSGGGGGVSRPSRGGN